MKEAIARALVALMRDVAAENGDPLTLEAQAREIVDQIVLAVAETLRVEASRNRERYFSIYPYGANEPPVVTPDDQLAKTLAQVSRGVVGNEAAAEIAIGRHLRCSSCDKQRAITPDEVMQYLADGWPSCCNQTMVLEARPPVDLRAGEPDCGP